MGPAVQKQLEDEREKVEARLQQVSDGIHHTLKSNFDLVADKVKKAHEDLKGLQVGYKMSPTQMAHQNCCIVQAIDTLHKAI